MNDYAARNTQPGKRGKWEVINYRTRERPALAHKETAESQGHMTKAEAMWLADVLNRKMERIEKGEDLHD